MAKLIGKVFAGAVYGLVVSSIASVIGFDPTYANLIGVVAIVSWHY